MKATRKKARGKIIGRAAADLMLHAFQGLVHFFCDSAACVRDVVKPQNLCTPPCGHNYNFAALLQKAVGEHDMHMTSLRALHPNPQLAMPNLAVTESNVESMDGVLRLLKEIVAKVSRPLPWNFPCYYCE